MTFQLNRESPNTPYKKPMEKFAMREKLSVVPELSAAERRDIEIYKAGWIQCALWAERLDLITDCDSAAFDKDMTAALADVDRRLQVGSEWLEPLIEADASIHEPVRAEEKR